MFHFDPHRRSHMAELVTTAAATPQLPHGVSTGDSDAFKAEKNNEKEDDAVQNLREVDAVGVRAGTRGCDVEQDGCAAVGAGQRRECGGQ